MYIYFEYVSLIFGFVLFIEVSSCTLNSVQYKRTGDSLILQFQAITVHPEDTNLFISNSITSPTGTLLALIYLNGALAGSNVKCNNCTFIGDAATGDLKLEIDDLQAVAAGTYRHIANGKERECTTVYMLGVPTKPVLTLNRQPSVGESVRLTCSSTSTTTPNNHGLSLTYSWKVNRTTSSDPRFSYSTNRHVLTITSVQKEDGSNDFTCTATETVSSGYTSLSSNKMSPNVLYGPESLGFSPSDTAYAQTENTQFGPVNCSASCYPTCSFKWTKLTQGSTVSNTSVLDLGKLTSSEAGTYRCTATRSGAASDIKDLTVDVIYGPRSISFSPAATSYREDEGFQFQSVRCNSQCWECAYSWTGPNSYSSSTAVLDLGKFTKAMAGDYICSVRNLKSAQQPEQRNNLKVEVRYLMQDFKNIDGPDSVSVIPVDLNYTVDEGSTFNNITCIADCFPACSYRWTKEGHSPAVSSTNILSLGRVEKSFTGRYTCTATNGDTQSKQSHISVTISVRYAPDVNVRLSSTDVNEGASLTLYCDGSGYPTTYKYLKPTQMWNDVLISNENNELSGSQTNSSIHFKQLQLQDTGTYTCALNNGIRDTDGVLNQVSSRNLTVEVLPKMLKDDFQYIGNIGDAINIRLPVYSFPDFESFTFTSFNGDTITSGQKYTITSQPETVETTFYGTTVSLRGHVIDISITNLEEDDFGSYTLNITNSLGLTSVKVFVSEGGEPSPPKNFQILDGIILPTFVWEKSFNGGFQQTFVIQTSVAGGDQWINSTEIHEIVKQHSINDDIFIANISGLPPATYNARIFAYNSMGDSDFVNLEHTFEVDGTEKDLPLSCLETDCKAVITGFSVGSVFVALYAVAITVYLILYRRRTTHKDHESRMQSRKQMTYANLSFMPGASGNTPENNEEGRNESVNQYTSLDRNVSDVTTTYDVIKPK